MARRLTKIQILCYLCIVTLKTIKILKGLNLLFAFLGGAAVGAVAGILFAPEKGSDMRARICKMLHDKGIHLKKEEMEQLVDQIAEEVKGVK